MQAGVDAQCRAASTRRPAGRGGSAYLHDMLAVGDEILADGPFNTFRLAGGPAHAVFIAGGIGITPFFTMTQACIRARATFELHYVARTRADHLPLQLSEEGAIFQYTSREPGERAGSGDGNGALDIRGVLERTRPDAHVYACGSSRAHRFSRPCWTTASGRTTGASAGSAGRATSR